MKNFYLFLAALLCSLASHAQFNSDTLTPMAVCNAANPQLAVAALNDGTGGSYVFWLDKRKNASNAEIYGQHLNASGDTLWAANGKLIAGTTTSILAFQTINWQNGILLTWAQRDSPGYGDSTFCKYIDNNGNDVWAKPTLIANKGVISGNTFISIDQDSYNVFANDSGATITHSYTISGGNSGFTFNRIDFNGNLYWPELSKTFVLNGYDYRSSSDGHSGFYALSKGNGEGSPMYIQHFSLQGNPTWTNGLDVTSGGIDGFTGNISMLPAADTSLYVTWDANSGNIAVSKVTPAGNFAWSAKRILLSDTSSYYPVRSYARLVGNNLFVTWLEQRISYVGSSVMQRLDTSGAILWGKGGRIIATVNVYDAYPKLAVADSGFMMNTFMGPVNSDMNVQRVRLDGSLTFAGNGKVLGSGNPQAVNSADYTVLDDTNGCNPVFWSSQNGDIFGSDACIIYGVATSVETVENNTAGLVTVFPNPARNYITVKNSAEQALNEVCIYDVTGKQLVKMVPVNNSSSLQINISQLQAGMYFIQSLSNGTVARNTFVVE